MPDDAPKATAYMLPPDLAGHIRYLAMEIDRIQTMQMQAAKQFAGQQGIFGPFRIAPDMQSLIVENDQPQ